VRNGTPGWSFLSGMPAYPAGVISDDELADVRAYLANLPAPPGTIAPLPPVREDALD
jgi:mono/diheme cytochrome c family protein